MIVRQSVQWDCEGSHEKPAGEEEVILSIIGIGIFHWMESYTTRCFISIGAKIQVQMYKHEDGRWLVSKIVSIAGKSLNTQQTGKSNPRKKAKRDTRKSKTKTQPKPKASVLRRLLKGTAGNLRKLYLYAMGGTNIDLQKLESRAQSLAPFLKTQNWQKNPKNISKKELALYGRL